MLDADNFEEHCRRLVFIPLNIGVPLADLLELNTSGFVNVPIKKPSDVTCEVVLMAEVSGQEDGQLNIEGKAGPPTLGPACRTFLSDGKDSKNETWYLENELMWLDSMGRRRLIWASMYEQHALGTEVRRGFCSILRRSGHRKTLNV